MQQFHTGVLSPGFCWKEMFFARPLKEKAPTLTFKCCEAQQAPHGPQDGVNLNYSSQFPTDSLKKTPLFSVGFW